MIRQSVTPKTSEKQRAYMKEYYIKNKTELQKRHRSYYQQHKDKILAQEKENRDPVSRWEYSIKRKFGISAKEYQQLLQEQNGTCAICLKKPSGRFKRLAVDHCHKTGVIRGLLCSGCNRAIGYLGDCPDILERASSYLKKNKG